MMRKHLIKRRPSKNISGTTESQKDIKDDIPIKKNTKKEDLIPHESYLTFKWLKMLNRGKFLQWINFKNFSIVSVSMLLLFILFGKPGVLLWVLMMMLLVPSALIIKWLSNTIKKGQKVETLDDDDEEDEEGQTEAFSDLIYKKKTQKMKEKLNYLKLKQELEQQFKELKSNSSQRESSILKTFESVVYYILNIVVISVTIFGVYFGTLSGLNAFVCLLVCLPLLFIVKKIGLIKISINISLALLMITIMIGIIALFYMGISWLISMGILTK